MSSLFTSFCLNGPQLARLYLHFELLTGFE